MTYDPTCPESFTISPNDLLNSETTILNDSPNDLGKSKTMNRNELVEKLIALAAKRFERAADTMTSSDDFFDKLGIDSFQAMELMTDLEDELDIEIPDYELQGVNTFDKLADVVEKRL